MFILYKYTTCYALRSYKGEPKMNYSFDIRRLIFRVQLFSIFFFLPILARTAEQAFPAFWKVNGLPTTRSNEEKSIIEESPSVVVAVFGAIFVNWRFGSGRKFKIPCQLFFFLGTNISNNSNGSRRAKSSEWPCFVMYRTWLQLVLNHAGYFLRCFGPPLMANTAVRKRNTAVRIALSRYWHKSQDIGTKVHLIPMLWRRVGTSKRLL